MCFVFRDSMVVWYNFVKEETRQIEVAVEGKAQ